MKFVMWFCEDIRLFLVVALLLRIRVTNKMVIMFILSTCRPSSRLLPICVKVFPGAHYFANGAPI